MESVMRRIQLTKAQGADNIQVGEWTLSTKKNKLVKVDEEICPKH